MSKRGRQVDVEELIQQKMLSPEPSRFRSAYDGLQPDMSRLTAFVPSGVSKTRQEFREDADINTIVKRFGLTGQLEPGARVPTYGDFSEVVDFRTALEVVMDAEQAFMRLPAAIRARFDNDPQALMEFVADRANLEEARRLGLVEANKEAPTGLSEPPTPPAKPGEGA